MGPIFAGCAWVRRSRKKHPFPICIAKDAFALDTDEQIRVVITGHSFTAVSYTHLDVYKRQASMWFRYCSKARLPAAERRYSVLGRRPAKDFVQVMYPASSSLRA